ncbi:MAG: aminodeoxychorismate synthase component I [Thermodesulfobacteriota bacterium]
MSKARTFGEAALDAGVVVSPSRKCPSPLAVFRALRSLEQPFILGGAPCPGHRYSTVGAAPFMRLTLPVNGKTVELKNAPEGLQKILKGEENSALFQTLSTIMKYLRTTGKAGPFPFNGGAAGFFSYDLKDSLFKLPPVRPEKDKKGLGLPLASLGFYDNIYVYDHSVDKGYIVSRSPEEKSSKDFFDCIEDAANCDKMDRPPVYNMATPLTSNTTKEEYIRNLQRAKEYIAAGDIYQINLSQRLSAPYSGDAFSLYEGLIRENPTPFSSFFDFHGFQILSNSPERLLKVSGQSIETCPIKGTRPRGATAVEDALNKKELAENIKERAEHVMIVDLERNDLGRVAIPGTVRVENFQEIKSFSKVHHMISTVRGRAPGHTDPFMILKDIFPGGSITGAPKIRAMEIIDELESVPREVYTGALGFMDYTGDMDLSITIRTAIIKDSRLNLHVGGGIVADSIPEAEYDETILKAMDFLSLLGVTPGELS